jgi:quercetin dioxygenase-like cupin family protein
MSYLSPDIRAEVRPPEQGILSRTLFHDDHVKLVIFGFSAGHEMSAHTAPVAATLQILEGRAEVRLGETVHSLEAGALAYMPPKLEHAITALTPLVMVLIMHRSA